MIDYMVTMAMTPLMVVPVMIFLMEVIPQTVIYFSADTGKTLFMIAIPTMMLMKSFSKVLSLLMPYLPALAKI